VDHLFACDIMPASRHFIAQNCRPKALFCDLLARETISHCLLAERPRVVPSNLDIYVAGFPCKDFSLLNRNRPCLVGPNASTFHGVVKYITNNTPRAFVLENVDGLTLRKSGGEAPIYTVMRILRNIPHYEVRAWKVNTRDYYLPQHRKRVYIVGVNTSKTRLRRPLTEWTELVRGLECKPRTIPQDFMLSSDQPEIESELMRLKEHAAYSRRFANTKSSKRGTKWVHVHHALRARMGLLQGAEWCQVTDQRRGWFPLIRAHARDCIELCAARLSSKTGRPAQETDAVAEIGRGATFSSVMEEVVPCLTPSGRLWVFNRSRWLIGVELLALQGFPVDDLDLNGLSPSQQALLAGNAMSVPVVGAFLFLLLALVVFPEEPVAIADDAPEVECGEVDRRSEIGSDVELCTTEAPPSDTARASSSTPSSRGVPLTPPAAALEAPMEAFLGSRVVEADGRLRRSSGRLASRRDRAEQALKVEHQVSEKQRSLDVAQDPLGQIPFKMVKTEGADDWIQCQGCHEWLPVHPEVIAIYKDAQNVRFYCRYITGRRCRSERRGCKAELEQDMDISMLARRPSAIASTHANSSSLSELTCHNCGETHTVGPNAFQRWRSRQVVCADLGLQCEVQPGA